MDPRSSWRAALCAVSTALFTGSADARQPSVPPLDVGHEERVEVRLVLVDLFVIDRRDRTVPGLTRDDFVVVAHGREVPVQSLDVDCPAGAAVEPLPGKSSRSLSAAPTSRPRRIVLVFDYYHIENAAETIDRALEMLDKWPTGGEEHMVISLGGVVRVESPFTTDLDETRRTLERMRKDRGLYAGSSDRLTEHPFFARLEILFDMLEGWEGRKSVVLFSGPLFHDGFYHDPEFKRLSGLSVATRTALYPVDSGGLRAPLGRSDVRMGGPPLLRRLAVETGGRMTADTNEIGLGYAKAHRDLGCTYTLGFHDPRPELDRRFRMTIRVRDRPGLRVVHPEYFVLRSPEEKRRSLSRAAAMTPELFDSPDLAVELFLLGPESGSRWRALLAVEYRPAPSTPVDDEPSWTLEGLLRRSSGTVVHSFERDVPPPRPDPASGRTPAVTLFHEIRVRPGSYAVSAVLSGPRADAPAAATRPVVVGEVPRGEPFIVGPLLGRPGDPTSRDAPTFEPLVTQEAEQGEPLDSLTVVCVVDTPEAVDVREIARAVITLAGDGALRFAPVSARLAEGRGVSCHEIVDPVVTADLDPGRYEFEAVAVTAGNVTGRGTTGFTILPAPAD